MALATLSIDLVAQLASLQAGMDKAGRLAERQAAQIEARYTRIADAGRAVGAALAGAISVAGLTAFFKATVDGLDALNDVKDATGATIENISALEDIAARTGTQFETVSSALLKFNKLLTDAKPGSETAALLQSIGLSAEELKKADPAEALRVVAVALEGYADSGEKARLVQQLFGKSTGEVAAFLKDLATQGKLNATVTTEQADAAERFNKELFTFQKNAVDAARAIAGQLLPAINGLFSAAKQDGGLAKLFGLDGLAGKVDQVVSAYQLLGLARERITPLSILEKDPANQRALADLARIDAKAQQLAGNFKAARAEMLGIGVSQAGGGRGFINPPLVRPDVTPPTGGSTGKRGGGRAADVVFAGPLLDPVRVDALRAIEQTDTARIEKLRETLTDLLTLSNTEKSPAVADAIQQVIDQITKLDPAAKALSESSSRIAAALAATPSAKKVDARARVDELQAELGKTQDPVRLRQIEEAIDAIYVGIDALPTVAEPAFAELDEVTKNFAASVQSTFGDTIFSALTGDFDNIGKAWLRMLLRMGADAIAADLTRSLFPGLKAGGAGGSALGSFFGAMAGGIGGLFGGIFGGGRATGGGVRPGGIYSVVENGPELLQMGGRTMLLMGKQGGQIIPAGGGGMAPAAPAMHVIVNNTFNGGVQRNEMAAYAASIKASVLAAVADAQRRSYNGAAA